MVLFFESYNPIGIQRLALAASSAVAMDAPDDMLTNKPA
jgi:hypothetical protein